jgi:hypothetical protein
MAKTDQMAFDRFTGRQSAVVTAPSHVGKNCQWEGSRDTDQVEAARSSAFANPAVTPIAVEIPKLASNR